MCWSDYQKFGRFVNEKRCLMPAKPCGGVVDNEANQVGNGEERTRGCGGIPKIIRDTVCNRQGRNSPVPEHSFRLRLRKQPHVL